MNEEEIAINIEKLKTKTDMLDEDKNWSQTSIQKLNEQFGHLNESIIEIKKNIKEVETVSTKDKSLLETITPNFVTKVKEQDMKVYSMNLDIKSIKKLQDNLIGEIKRLKGKLEFFDYPRVVHLNKEMTIKLKDMKKLDATIEKNSKKMEDMFIEFEKSFVEFKKLKTLNKQMSESFENYSKDFNSLRQEIKTCAGKDKITVIEKKIKDLNNKFKGKKEVKNKSKKRWWLF